MERSTVNRTPLPTPGETYLDLYNDLTALLDRTYAALFEEEDQDVAQCLTDATTSISQARDELKRASDDYLRLV